MPAPSFKILVVSLPGSPKRDVMRQRLSAQHLTWEWVDGVRIATMEEIPWWEREGLEAYCIARLKTTPEYVCRAVGCKRAMRKAIALAETCSEDWVLILQDDAVLAPAFRDRLEGLLSLVPYEAGCVMLHRGGSRVAEIDGWQRVTGDVRSMTAFAIRPSFALIMSRALENWNSETDRIWGHLVRQGEIILSPIPMLVTCSQKQSDIIGGIPELRWLWK